MKKAFSKYISMVSFCLVSPRVDWSMISSLSFVVAYTGLIIVDLPGGYLSIIADKNKS